MTLISWNVNGLRAALKKNFEGFLATQNPDIICLQETKAEDHQIEADFLGYDKFWCSSEIKKGYSGTAILTKIKPINVTCNFPDAIAKKYNLIDSLKRDANREGRILTIEFDKFFLVNVYTPNAKEDLSRLSFRFEQWDPAFLEYTKSLEKNKSVIICGDLNVAHQEIDLARPKENVGKHGFTNEERAGFDKFIKTGFVDTLRAQYPNKPELYTWWSNWGNARERNVGWRIDYFLMSVKLKKQITDAFILPHVMGSDHCPVGITLDL
ncbi:MAG: exodeoxyribonuclease III [Candidatus Magasanikbacteria bacterium RIFCSPHIGHO2_01_FULL_41_23]|uniref:Exodeoxyribonuclease III n=1 Tax=Candidatus Magasanikbacteria bacterium RIFCSPLOWO2_01_FULL_40_15 TaxID=1798686 RepID=A0A1F6N4B3_9BACT|nr:MAG: exodeoxyribonuclease III [Candidatus Magasanikbacteria bacterium RIFCSPHIGHO2_01_FULL_41_23]OGH67221.1 MAG: exodeoxyribonuclease III [Candidatus Magasanikbacteria bacterium RIFCSPHIGHO2_02_FULL_41_35]OGH78757.1 MAG: exodeoxyribonuclease III [Candidatus Magasanikbacteria bacterium RIFCSPLOWO2_01_FULL_40_15]